MNKVILVGRLGQDPELKTIGETAKVCNFSLATSEGKDKQGNKLTEWHKISAWNKTAELCIQYLNKGSSVLVEGRIKTRNYEKDGTKIFVTEIMADRVEFLDSKSTKTEVVKEGFDETGYTSGAPF